jgi:hypothetical protein
LYAVNSVGSANYRTQLDGTAAAPRGIKMKHFLPVKKKKKECTFICIKALELLKQQKLYLRTAQKSAIGRDNTLYEQVWLRFKINLNTAVCSL